MSTWALYLIGVALAGMFIVLARWRGRSPVPALAAGLLLAAAVYVGFAVSAAAGGLAITRELMGVAVYGSFARAGLRHSPGWLVAGWASHVAWDIGLHLLAPYPARRPRGMPTSAWRSTSPSPHGCRCGSHSHRGHIANRRDEAAAWKNRKPRAGRGFVRTHGGYGWTRTTDPSIMSAVL